MFVPRTDTGTLAEKAKMFKIICLREFGKLATYLWYTWCLLSDEQVSVTRRTRLFNKNIIDCQTERFCIVNESWPLVVC